MIAPILVFVGCPQPQPEKNIEPAAPAPQHTFTFTNSCKETIWVGSFGQNGSAAIGGGGWEMAHEQVMKIQVPVGHSGRVWTRTGCVFDEQNKCPTTGVNCCTTGGCLTSNGKDFGLECAQTGVPPASLLEWTLDAVSGNGPIDYYDQSYVDGWSVPMRMKPVAGSFNPETDPGIKTWWCESSECVETPVCPSAFKVEGSPDSCMSPCQAATQTGSPDVAKLCCSGQYSETPYHQPPYPEDQTCNPWSDEKSRAWDQLSLSYIQAVKQACPKAYSWAFDDTQATFNCRKTDGLVDYEIEFCPPVVAQEP